MLRAAGARWVRLAAVAVLVFAGTGCATLFSRYDVTPSGLAADEHRLRRELAAGRAEDALARTDSRRHAPDDDVLRALYRGVIAYHAGDYEESARILDAVAEMADERATKRLSRSALSLVSNDLVLPYEPGRTERLMIPWYAALARVHMGDLSGAAVEARRLSMLLQYQADHDERVEPALEAVLRHVAGAIFEASGHREDAQVAYRNAAALDSAHARAHGLRDGHGTVLVVVEQGFVAHRAEQDLAVLLLPEEVKAITDGDGEERSAAAALVAARVIRHALAGGPSHEREGYRRTLHVPAPPRPERPRHEPRQRRAVNECTSAGHPADQVASADTSALRPRGASVRQQCTTEEQTGQEEEDEDVELPYLLKVSWPVYRAEARPAHTLRILAGDDEFPVARVADVSRSVVADFESERLLIAARTIARGTVRLAAVKGAERKLDDVNETAAKLLSVIGNVGSVLLERADTRSWHLLPAGVSVARLELPAGEHDLTLELDGGAASRSLLLGPITVRPGELAIVPVRAW